MIWFFYILYFFKCSNNNIKIHLHIRYMPIPDDKNVNSPANLWLISPSIGFKELLL